MPGRRAIIPGIVLAAVVGLAPVPGVRGAADAEPARIEYPARATDERAPRVVSVRRSLPRKLYPNARSRPGRTGFSGRPVTTRQRIVAPGQPVSRDVEIFGQARDAALHWADWLVETEGRREYFRVGFHDGMRQALEDPTLGDRDYTEGEHAGWRDPEARARGLETGELAAIDLAAERAEIQVFEQFTRLDAEPVYLPRSDRPHYLTELPVVESPRIEDLFIEHPLVGISFADHALSRFFDGWDYDAARLYACEDWQEFYDDEWRDAPAAFTDWTERPDLAAFYFTLADESGRRWFENSFIQVLEERLAASFETRLLHAFEHGTREGWRYGALLNEELRYREGFLSGYLSAVEDAARVGFEGRYVEQYEASYRSVFDDWSHHAKPELGAIRLLDANDDGVFQPGEALFVDFELVNHGGGAGRFALQLDGDWLERSADRIVELAPRSILTSTRPLAARISELTPGRTRTRLALTFADRAVELPLEISYPLQLKRGAWRLHRSNLVGEAVLELDVENQSRSGLEGTVELTTAALPGFVRTTPLGTVEAGEVRRVSFAVAGLDPFDLIAGRVSLEVELRGAGERQDRFTYHLPDAARDLGNRDLLIYMVREARDGAAAARAAALRELLMLRLREDWKLAVARRGNPYKFDFRNDGATTALGDLVRTYREQGAAVRDHLMFGGLSGEILALADQLPGIHPYLRRYVRKLALELP